MNIERRKKRGFLGLGANLGDRAQTLKMAVAALQNSGKIELKRVSHAYETAPIGPQDQPAFLNLVAEIETALSAEELFRVVKEIERGLGRKARIRWGPREIDIDILLLDEEEIQTEALTIPHPQMHERAFVMVPLAELEPNLTVKGEPARKIAARLAREQTIGEKFSL